MGTFIARVAGFFAIVSIAILCNSQYAQAADDMSVNSRLKYGDASQYCDDWAKGMVWLSNDGTNYYSEKVTAPFNADSVDVEVRGAVNTCDTLMDDRKENRAYAGEVKSTSPSLTIKGTEFYRGNVPSNTANAWSTKGVHLNATLDIKDTAVCRGIAEIQTGTITVQIYRKLIWEKVEYDGSSSRTEAGDGTESIDITIQRNCPNVVRPKTTVVGGDLLVRGDVKTSVNTVDGLFFGSWGEYGVAASGLVKGMSSGSGFVGGVKTLNGCSLYLLTFTNATSSKCSASTLGRYNKLRTSPASSIVALAKNLTNQKTTSGAQSLEGFDTDTVYQATGDITLTAITALPKAKWVVINAAGRTVRIDSNLTYQNGPYASVNDIPQLVIIAQNIIVKDSVNRIDAWLVAPSGSIVTCDAPGVSEPAQLKSNVCNTRLVVNGPVMANSLKLYRTHGAPTRPGIHIPAETFNLRADAYLWMQALHDGQLTVRTANTIELPPRF